MLSDLKLFLLKKISQIKVFCSSLKKVTKKVMDSEDAGIKCNFVVRANREKVGVKHRGPVIVVTKYVLLLELPSNVKLELSCTLRLHQ